MHNITLQLFNHGKWWDAAELTFENEQLSVLEELSDFCDSDDVFKFLSELADRLIYVRGLLKELNCPDEILDFPSIGFNSVPQSLMKMGLINE